MNTLAKRAGTQLAGLLIPFALIFVSAGTIHFWQGWLFWLSFSVSSAATGIYLLKRDPRCWSAGCDSDRALSRAQPRR
jgi:hypothetical protein